MGFSSVQHTNICPAGCNAGVPLSQPAVGVLIMTEEQAKLLQWRADGLLRIFEISKETVYWSNIMLEELGWQLEVYHPGCLKRMQDAVERRKNA